MNLNDLTADCADLDRATLLNDWLWLIGENKLPMLVTLAGDVFVQDTKTGEVFFLDTVDGYFDRVADSGDRFQGLLTDEAFVVEYFAVELVAPLLRAKQRPGAGQLFSFRKPPVLGGVCETSNLEATDIAVHFSM